jgi:hypothetical protein
VGRQIYPPGAGALVRKERKTVSTGQRARKAKANTRQAEPSGPLSGPYLSATNMKSREISAGSQVMIRTRCLPEPLIQLVEQVACHEGSRRPSYDGRAGPG